MSTLQACPPMIEAEMTSIGEILTSVFRPVPCDFCPGVGPTYRDPETGCFYCLPCLEMATDEASTLEDGPEDPETVAYGMAFLDGYFAPTARAQAA